MHGACAHHMEAGMRTLSIGRISVAASALLLAGTLWAGTEGAVAPGTEDGKAGHAGKDVYGIVNLASSTNYWADVNARGHAAFQYYGSDGDFRVGFFDGDRIIDIGPPTYFNALFDSLNERSEIALSARFLEPGSEIPSTVPFRWSPARGLVTLPNNNSDRIYLGSMNNRGEIVGATGLNSDSTFRAVRWTTANRVLPLPSVPGATETAAADINDSNVSIGYGAEAGAEIAQVMVWDAAGRPRSLGTLGARSATGRYINNRGDIAGTLGSESSRAFLLSPGKPILRAPPRTSLNALNEVGEIVGAIYPTEGVEHYAYLFSRARGLIQLHPRAFLFSDAVDVNDSGVAVGLAYARGAELERAFRWSRASGAVDLNTRLLDPPAGLELIRAHAISANGDIVADSNAGLVLLRAGGRGTDAPVLGPLQFVRVPANAPARYTLSFRDRNLRETHTATIDWGDGAGPQPVPLREHQGRGLIDVVHTYPEWGIFRVVVRVTDSAGRSTSLESQVWLLDSFGLLKGEGILADKTTSPSTAFRLAAPLAPKAKAGFSFHLLGATSFRADQLDNVRVEGNRVWLEGAGRLDGRPGYRFAIDAMAGDRGAQASRMAVKITQADPKGGGQRLVFQAGEETQTGQAQLAQAGQLSQAGKLRQGSIQILRQAD